MLQNQWKHELISWNPATQEWFCTKCGRTSDHTHEKDARVELEQHECYMPWAEMPKAVSNTPE
ncbi:MAG: hypothetical protein LAO18_16995 [Acidobacteriia bacterium]|nr:hypothetical protein [Terriglobia bacterium]